MALTLYVVKARGVYLYTWWHALLEEVEVQPIELPHYRTGRCSLVWNLSDSILEVDDRRVKARGCIDCIGS